MNPLRPKAWQALLYRVRHLALEIDDRKEVVQANSAEFLALVRREMGEPERAQEEGEPGLVPAGQPQRGPEVPPRAGDEPGGDAEPTEAAERPPEAVRKLWRTIAVATHPDKVGSDGERGKLYRRASAAWQERNWSELVGVALELGLPIEPDESLYQALVAVRDRHEEQLDGIEETALWQWLIAETDERRSEIIREVSAQLSAKAGGR